MSATPLAANRTPEAATAVVKFHSSLNVSDLAKSVEFYNALFGTKPVKVYADYVKFEVDVPPLVLSLKPTRAVAQAQASVCRRAAQPPRPPRGHRRTTAGDSRPVEDGRAQMGQQDDVKCCYAHQTKIWVTDPDQTMWEVYVLHDDVPNWGEKDKKLKLLVPPFKALGLWGSIRRGWNNKFGRKASATDGAASIAEHAEPVAAPAPVSAESCTSVSAK